jgi:hypothetical protein
MYSQLGRRRRSRKSIEIGITPGTSAGMLDFSSLRWLGSCIFQYTGLLPGTPSDARRKLAPPCLASIVWASGRKAPPRWPQCTRRRKQVHWMQDFAKLKTRSHPDSLLKAIFIHFNPRNPASRDHYGHDLTWPWDYLDETVRNTRSAWCDSDI